MTNILISDLHLEAERPEMAELFFKFLRTDARQAKALYILGDLFEAWIGDDDLTPFNQTVIQNLQHATSQGLPIFILHGNRDFLLGKKFLKKSGCRFLKDASTIQFYGAPVLLMHGDTLCTQDVAYLKFRKKARNKFFQTLFLLKSLKTRRKIAENIRAHSKQHTATSPDHIMDVTQTEVERVMQKHRVQYLIHGHTHREAIHTFSIDNQPATRIVLGAWHTEGSALRWNEKGKFELIQIK